MTRADDGHALDETVASPTTAETRAESDGDDELGSMASAMRALAATPRAEHGGVAPGTVIDGTFRVERKLGEGGMGVVFLARDLKLDREVALKIGTAASAAALARAGREAIALARLSHPNVVVVHQVGEVRGRLYIAMEYVPGGSARDWLKAAPRSWREIVALYAAAGDGLAAAHAAGLVHRDVKPDNVLVGDDGRPRVGDFGLVRGADEPAEAADAADGDADAFSPITQTGTVMGTPAYMAPEQLAGRDVDARADQFAFAAALWEALFGARPFRGASTEAITAAMAAGPPRPPDDDRARRVPRHVVAALARALAPDRDARWPSMAPLLAELRRDPRGRRRTIAIAAGAAVLAAAIAVPLALRTRSHDAPCEDGAAIVASSWNPERSAELAAAFDRYGLGDLGRTVAARLDRYAIDWAAAHRDACRATRVDRSQTEAMLDRRNLCLDRARDRLDAVVGKLTAAPDRTVAQAARDAIDLLPDLAGCADVESLGTQTPLPADPAARAKVEAADKQVSAAVATVYDDWDKDPLGVADRALAAAKDAGWPPLIAAAARARAEALQRLGRTPEAIDGYEEAFEQAVAGGDDVYAGWAAVDLADMYIEDSPHDADRWIAIARGFWDRVRKPDDLGAYIERAAATRAIDAGDTGAGVDATRRANAMVERNHPDPLDLADDHDHLAGALLNDRKIDEARTEIEAAIALASSAYGDHHPYIAGLRLVASEIARFGGRLDDAVALAKRAVDDLAAWYGADAPATGDALAVLGTAESTRGDQDAALADLGKALAIHQKSEPGSLDIAEEESNLAMAEDEAARFPAALGHAREALAAMAKIQGADSPTLVEDLVILAGAERGTRDLDGSERDLRRALALVEKAYGASDPRDINTRIELSYTLVLHGKAREAAGLLAPSIAQIAAGAAVEPQVAAECHTAYADALWASGGDRARARAEATTGRDAFAKLGDTYAKQRGDADAWLAAHPLQR